MASQPTFDLQVPGRPEFLGQWMVRAPRLRQLVRRHGRLWPLRPRTATTTRRSRKAPTTASPPPTISRSCAASAAPGLRHFVGRAARRDVRGASSGHWSPASRSTPWCGPAKARPTLAERKQEAAGIPGQEPAADRQAPSSIRSSTATIPAPPRTTSSTPSPTPILALDSSVPTGTYVDMCAHLPVVDPAKITAPTLDHARPVGRHRERRRPASSSSSAAQPRQAVHRHARHLARELPAEELHAGLSYSLSSFFSQPAPVYRG